MHQAAILARSTLRESCSVIIDLGTSAIIDPNRDRSVYAGEVRRWNRRSLANAGRVHGPTRILPRVGAG